MALKTRSFLALVMLLALLVGGLSGGALALGRATGGQDSCLHTWWDQHVVDSETGFYMRSRAAGDFSEPPASWPSPDGRFTVWEETHPDTGMKTLSVQAADQPDQRQTVLDTPISMVQDVIWSPDSARFLFVWVGDWNLNQGEYYLGVADADGRNVRSEEASVGMTASGMPTFLGWSDDGRHFATSVYAFGGTAYGDIVRVWSVDPLKPLRAVNVAEQDYQAVWSPGGTRLAVLYNDALGRSKMEVATTERDQPFEVALPDGRFGAITWSPDGVHLAYRYLDNLFHARIAIFRLEDGRGVQVGNILRAERQITYSAVAWSADGKNLIYWGAEGLIPTALALYRYDMASGTSETLLENAETMNDDPLAPLADNPAGRTAVAYLEPAGELAVDLVSADLAARIPLVRGARRILSVFWSPDRARVLVQWLARDGATLSPRLTWANADGSSLTVLEDLGAALSESRWLPDGRSMVMLVRTGEEDNRFAVDLLDLITNRRQRLAGNLLQVSSLNVTADGEIVFWWRTTDAMGVDGYLPDGSLLYRFGAPVPDMIWGWLARSPDNAHAVMLTVTRDEVSAVLVTNGDPVPRVLITPFGMPVGPTGGGVVTWAGDSSRFAIAHTNLAGWPALTLYRADGSLLREWGRPDDSGGRPLRWSDCR